MSDKLRRVHVLAATGLGVVLWLVVTLASLAIVLESPADHVGLALFLVLIWLLLLGSAAVTRRMRRRAEHAVAAPSAERVWTPDRGWVAARDQHGPDAAP